MQWREPNKGKRFKFKRRRECLAPLGVITVCVYLKVNEVDTIRVPEVVGAVELEEEEVGQEQERNTADVHIHQQVPKTSGKGLKENLEVLFVKVWRKEKIVRRQLKSEWISMQIVAENLNLN